MKDWAIEKLVVVKSINKQMFLIPHHKTLTIMQISFCYVLKEIVKVQGGGKDLLQLMIHADSYLTFQMRKHLMQLPLFQRKIFFSQASVYIMLLQLILISNASINIKLERNLHKSNLQSFLKQMQIKNRQISCSIQKFQFLQIKQ